MRGERMVGIIVFLIIAAMSMTAMNVHDWYTRKEIEKRWHNKKSSHQ